jgi:hypothetical protein
MTGFKPPPVRLPKRKPAEMYGTYLRLDVNVRDNPRTIIRAARRKLADKARRDPAYREARKRFYREMLEYHADAQRLVVTFRL